MNITTELQNLLDTGIPMTIAGSYVLSLLHSGFSPSDIDVYTSNPDGIMEWCYSNGYSFYDESNYGTKLFKEGSIPINVIEVFDCSPYSVVDAFDLTICQVAIYMESGEPTLFKSSEFQRDYPLGRMSVHRPYSSSITWERVHKYIRRGFTISQYEARKLTHEVTV